jgi:hypothetical protein
MVAGREITALQVNACYNACFFDRCCWQLLLLLCLQGC